ncbi:hypothetical protein D3C78_1560520 [compost metagenome]
MVLGATSSFFFSPFTVAVVLPIVSERASPFLVPVTVWVFLFQFIFTLSFSRSGRIGTKVVPFSTTGLELPNFTSVPSIHTPTGFSAAWAVVKTDITMKMDKNNAPSFFINRTLRFLKE